MSEQIVANFAMRLIGGQDAVQGKVATFEYLHN